MSVIDRPRPCLYDMGGGVTCQRPLTVLHDPLEWRCGWGHRWCPSSVVDRVSMVPTYDTPYVEPRAHRRQVIGLASSMRKVDESFSSLTVIIGATTTAFNESIRTLAEHVRKLEQRRG